MVHEVDVLGSDHDDNRRLRRHCPFSEGELACAILVVLVGSILYAYLFGIIATYVSQLDTNAHLFRTRLAVFESFVKAKRLSKVARARTRLH